MSIFSDYTPTEAEVDSVRSSTHWEADVQPDEPTAPLTSEERTALDEADAPTFQPVLTDQQTDRAEHIPGEWVSPRLRHQRKQAALLPRAETIKALEDALFEVARHEMAPEELSDAITEARKACQEAYSALDKARHPEAPRQTRNAAAKQAAIKAIDAARAAVNNAVQVSERDDIRERQYQAIVSGIGEAQERAAEALDVATAEFARWRALITAGDDLAKAAGVFGADWHRHKDERSINPRGLVGDLRRARDLARTEDVYLSGQYLVEDPTEDGSLPEWTRESLAAGTEYERTILWRLDKKHPNDPSAADSLEQKSLRPILNATIPMLHPEARAEGFGVAPDNDWD